MAYTKTVWETGDVITAEKLNNMESGIGTFCARVSYNDETWTCDKTIAQIIEAYDAGRPVYVILVQGGVDTFFGHLSFVSKEVGSESVTFFGYQYLPDPGAGAIFLLQYTSEGITISNVFVAS